jgi:hypothetical protein
MLKAILNFDKYKEHLLLDPQYHNFVALSEKYEVDIINLLPKSFADILDSLKFN